MTKLPKPYWQSECGKVTLYCGDCRKILPYLPKGSVDAVVTDPPYGIGHATNYATRGRGALARSKDYPTCYGDDKPFDPSWLVELESPLILWGGNHFASRLSDSGGWLVWDKERPDDIDQSTCELAWSNIVKGIRRFKYLWHGCMRKGNERLTHPMQKPVALWVWVLTLRWVCEFQTLCDPFMGSGSCGVAAVRLGRRFIGIEIEENYCAIARKRIESELRKPTLIPKGQMQVASPCLIPTETLKQGKRRKGRERTR